MSKNTSIKLPNLWPASVGDGFLIWDLQLLGKYLAAYARISSQSNSRVHFQVHVGNRFVPMHEVLQYQQNSRDHAYMLYLPVHFFLESKAMSFDQISIGSQEHFVSKVRAY